MKKKELLRLMNKPDLIRLFRSEAMVDEIIAIDTRLQEMFIERLPETISADDIFNHWATDWKKFDKGFVPTLKTVSYCEFKKIRDLGKLITYWQATLSRHLRAVIRQIVLELLPKRRLRLTPKLISELNFIIFDHSPSD